MVEADNGRAALETSDADRKTLEARWHLSTAQDPAYNPNLGNASARYWFAHPPRVPINR